MNGLQAIDRKNICVKDKYDNKTNKTQKIQRLKNWKANNEVGKIFAKYMKDKEVLFFIIENCLLCNLTLTCSKQERSLFSCSPILLSSIFYPISPSGYFLSKAYLIAFFSWLIIRISPISIIMISFLVLKHPI